MPDAAASLPPASGDGTGPDGFPLPAVPAPPAPSEAAPAAPAPAAPGSAFAAPAAPAPSGAMPSVLAGLGVLARADWAGTPSVTLGGMLVDLERAESVLVAARSRVLAAFTAQRGFEDDGQGSARTWLTWQSRITRPAASAAVSWARRLGEHPGPG